LYEAYVIQSFVYYLIELLGGEDRMAELLMKKGDHLGEHGKIMSAVFRMERWQMGKDFLLKIKHGVLQYGEGYCTVETLTFVHFHASSHLNSVHISLVVVKTFLTLLTTFVLLPSGLYGEGV
jgi:hypothetical protein